ncbi:MAG: hypothetical protein RLZZ200_1091 [Pseudomonadota bacterium]
MASRPIDLQGYFPYFLGTIANRWTTTSSRLYFERFGIGIGEWRVLASVFSLGQASSVEVVNLISMDAGAVSRSMRRLEQSGYVTPVEGRFSGRTKPYTLTAAGKALYAQIQRVALQREKDLLSGLTEAERRTLVELMGKVLDRLGSL